MLRSFVVLRLRRRLILAVRSVCLVQAPPAPTPSAVRRRLPTFSVVQLLRLLQSRLIWRMHSLTVQLLRLLDLMAVQAVLPAAENNLSGTQFCGALAALSGPVCRAGSVGVRKGDARHLSRGALVAHRPRSGGGQRQGRRAVSGFVTGFGQQARCECADVGSCLDSDVPLSCRVENPSALVARVNTALHQNSHSTLARSLHDVHVARCVQNSLNSLGDGVVRGRSVCSIQAGFENSLEDADFAVAGAENDFNDAQVVVPGSSGAGAGFSCSLQDDFVVVKSRTLGTSSSRGEVNLSGAQLLPGAGLLGTGTSRYDPKRGQREVAELVTMRPSSSPVSTVGRRQRRVRGARVLPPAAGGICTVSQCNEAGSSLDLASIRVESPSPRVARVTSALHNLCLAHSRSIPALDSHARMPHARCVVNSVGDTEVGRRLSCVPRGTKSLSTSTRSGVRRSAVYESAHTQQTRLKMHVETWAGLLRNQGPKIFREVEIVLVCAVVVACPSCPDYFLSHLGKLE